MQRALFVQVNGAWWFDGFWNEGVNFTLSPEEVIKKVEQENGEGTAVVVFLPTGDGEQVAIQHCPTCRPTIPPCL